MDKYQASVAPLAVIEPDLRGQDERRAGRRAHEVVLARQRQLGWFGLAGIACGAAIAYYLDVRMARGVIWGAITGASIGLVVRWLQGRAAT
jgi:hypothetical protein